MDNIDDYPQIASRMRSLPRLIETCRSVAGALIEMRQPWASRIFGVTDYQRGRERVMQTLRELQLEFRRTRNSILDPRLIQDAVRLTRIIACCQSCPHFNMQRLARTEPFLCRLGTQAASTATPDFRFVLDEKGQIHESI